MSCSSKETHKILEIATKLESAPLSNNLALIDSVTLDPKNQFLNSIDKIFVKKRYYLLNRFDQKAVHVFSREGNLQKVLKLPFESSEPVYDFLIDSTQNKIELLSPSGIYDYNLNDFSFIKKRKISNFATRFTKVKDYYYFVCGGGSGNYFSVTDSNLTHLYGYLPKFPAHNKHPHNSFIKINDTHHLFTNYNNTLYSIEDVKLEKGITFSFDNKIIHDNELWDIPKLNRSQFQYDAVLERFVFSVQNHLFFSYTKNQSYYACLLNTASEKTSRYKINDVLNDVTNQNGFPYIIGTAEDKYFISLDLSESDDIKLYILEPTAS